MKIKHVLITVALAASTVGCATNPSGAGMMVRFADINGVSDCQYLGPVNGSSGWGGLMNDVGVNNAQNEALDKAARLGATHIVNKSSSGGWGSTFLADAYKCN